MTAFNHLKSVLRLNELAEDPYDLTGEINLSPKRIDAMLSEGLGLKLFYATERVSEITMQALYDLAEETKVLDKMKRMQAGEAINCIEGVESENRSVLHTAMRDFFEHPNDASQAKEASQLAYQELEKLVEFLKDLEAKDRFTDMVQV
ncbi:MAG: glucose-6-phosphate isomerase, partial [Chlamydiae bacterium]|nr:glucose-6-phosphate isomerase [Chlamydiota bacterium]